jgi:hypothetical protein
MRGWGDTGARRKREGTAKRSAWRNRWWIPLSSGILEGRFPSSDWEVKASSAPMGMKRRPER